MPTVPLGLNLLHATVKDLQQALNTGECTSVDLVGAYLVTRLQAIIDRSSTYTISKSFGLRWVDGDYSLSPDAQAGCNPSHS